MSTAQTFAPISVLLLAALSTGCVTKHKHASLQEELAHQEAVNAELQRDLADARSDQIELSAEVWELEAELAQLERDIALAEGLDEQTRAAYTRMVQDLRPLMQDGEVSVRYVDGQLHLMLSEAVFFESGEATLTTEGLNKLASMAQIMREYEQWNYQVRGHTDSVPVADGADYSSNWELGAERAVTVVEQLTEHESLPSDIISAASYADTQPISPNSVDWGKADNRRVEIAVIPQPAPVTASAQ